MRTCPNCGHMLSEKDTICFKCGMQLSQISKPNSMGPGPQQPMMGMNNKNVPKGMLGKGMPNKGIPAPNKPSDNSKMTFIILGVVVVLAIIAVVIVFVSKNSKYDENENKNNNDVVLKRDDEETPKKVDPEADPDPKPETPSEQPTTPPSEPSTPVAPSTKTECGTPVITEGYHLVSNNGYGYAVPDEYTAKDYGTKGFDILDYKKTKEMIISINLGTLDNLKNTLPAVKQMYIDSGAAVHNIKVTTIADIEVICIELSKNGQNMVFGITDAADGEIFVIAVWDAVNNEFNYDILEEGIKIVKSAKKTACSNITNTSSA